MPTKKNNMNKILNLVSCEECDEILGIKIMDILSSLNNNMQPIITCLQKDKVIFEFGREDNDSYLRIAITLEPLTKAIFIYDDKVTVQKIPCFVSIITRTIKAYYKNDKLVTDKGGLGK